MFYLLRTFKILRLQLLADPRTTIYSIQIIFIQSIHVLLFTITLFSFYYNSAVRDCNNIPYKHRNVDSVMAFKNVLSLDKPVLLLNITFLEIGKNKSFTHTYELIIVFLIMKHK